jgi:heat shock protein HslJ
MMKTINTVVGSMAETKVTSEGETEIEETSDERKPEEKPGLAFFGALALVLFLVFLILFANVQGTRASAGIAMTRHEWIVQSYADPSGKLVPVIPETNVTARFGTDGRVSGMAGCNSYAAPYTVNDYGIMIGSLIKTEMYCSAHGIMQQESDYLSDLPNASVMRISDNQLNFYDTKGKPILVFVSG